MQKEMEFWLPKPKLWGFQTKAILIPVIASAAGLFLMSVEALVFAQFDSLPQDFRLWTSIVSAFFMAFGGEVGTVSNTTFIFSRWVKSNTKFYSEWDKVTVWDWTSLIVSWLSTVLSMFIAASTRPSNITSWQQVFAEWLILPLMIVAVSDVYSGIIELGITIGQFDMQMIYWIGRKREWDKEGNISKTKEKLICWCGKQLKNERAYNAHLRAHKNEALEFDDPLQAHNKLGTIYKDAIENENADFDFPSISDFKEWFKERKDGN